MKTITIDKKEYFDLIKMKDIIERIIDSAREKEYSKKNSAFLDAFGVLKNNFKGNSLNYVSKIRKEWR